MDFGFEVSIVYVNVYTDSYPLSTFSIVVSVFTSFTNFLLEVGFFFFFFFSSF